MPRPTFTINTPNQLAILRVHFDRMLPRFATLPGVVGITLNGGMSRGYADHLSEIDVTFYLDSDVYQNWKGGNAPFGAGIQMIEGMLYDLKFLNLEEERTRDWEMVTCWDMSYAEIVHDPTGAIAALCAEKLKNRPDPLEAGGPLFACWWYFELAGNIWIYRADPLQGHMMLNQSVTELLKALFLANAEFIPHEKWLLHFSRTLEWTPPDWESRLTSVLCELSPTVDSLKQRQQTIAALWRDIDRHIINVCLVDYPAELSLPHRDFYDLMLWLAKDGSISISDWEKRSTLERLNSAPFNLCVRMDSGYVALDWERLMSLTGSDLYSWHYSIIEAVRAKLKQQTPD